MTKKKVKQTRMNFTNDQHSTAPDQIQFLPESPNNRSTLSTRTSSSSTSNSKSLASVTPDKEHNTNKMVRITSSPFLKHPIYPREGTNPDGNKLDVLEMENLLFLPFY